MFWRKKETIDWPLTLFGLVVLFIFISAIGSVIFGLIAYQKGYIRTESSKFIEGEGVSPFVPTIEITTPLSVRQDYTEALANLIQNIDTGEVAPADVVSSVEDIFFSIRVPETKKDAHLDTFLSIQNLGKVSQGESLVSGVLGLLEALRAE
ncbi:MAG: hypothetical protein ABII02_01485 [Candidatus Magasanikbacteria bacterium]